MNHEEYYGNSHEAKKEEEKEMSHAGARIFSYYREPRWTSCVVRLLGSSLYLGAIGSYLYVMHSDDRVPIRLRLQWLASIVIFVMWVLAFWSFMKASLDDPGILDNKWFRYYALYGRHVTNIVPTNMKEDEQEEEEGGEGQSAGRSKSTKVKDRENARTMRKEGRSKRKMKKATVERHEEEEEERESVFEYEARRGMFSSDEDERDALLPFFKLVGEGGITFCRFCGIYRPERAHHCKVCGVCFYKMDHHCPMLGNCVARHNYKSFMLCLFWTGLTAMTMVGCSLPSTIACFRSLKNVGLDIQYQAPPTNAIAAVLLTWLIVSGGFGLGCLILWMHHMILVTRNTTSIEDSARIERVYDIGLKANLEQAFGTLGPLWLLPTRPKLPELIGFVYPRATDKLLAAEISV